VKIITALVAMSLSACAIGGWESRVTSNLMVDGKRFSPNSCGSGKALGFYGVEFTDSLGERLRLANAIDGSFEAVYFPSGNQIGEKLGQCGNLTLKDGMRLDWVDGSAKLACESGKHKVSGGVDFALCR
jgi:hypothetical protein